MKQATQVLVGALTTALTLVAVAGAATAQDQGKASAPAFKRTVLQKLDISAPGREAVQITAEFPSGTGTGKHTHPGEEVGYVLEGPFVFEAAGKAPVTLKTGDHFSVPAGTVHEGKNAGSGTAKVVITYILEKGKPLSSPAK